VIAQRVKALLAQAVSPSSVVVDGNLTRPPTWGVYEIDPPRGVTTKRFRIGNHPVRQRELTDEFGGPAKLRALFRSRTLAVELAEQLNGSKAAKR
jgi:hypothetical protein